MSKKSEVEFMEAPKAAVPSSPPPPYVYGAPQQMPPSYTQAMMGMQPMNLTIPPDPFPKNGPQIMTTVIPLGPEQTHMICPFCHEEIYTRTRKKPRAMTYLSCVLLFVFGCSLGCCLIPFCINTCMSISHSCPNCDAYLGKYRD